MYTLSFSYYQLSSMYSEYHFFLEENTPVSIWFARRKEPGFPNRNNTVCQAEIRYELLCSWLSSQNYSVFHCPLSAYLALFHWLMLSDVRLKLKIFSLMRMNYSTARLIRTWILVRCFCFFLVFGTIWICYHVVYVLFVWEITFIDFGSIIKVLFSFLI